MSREVSAARSKDGRGVEVRAVLATVFDELADLAQRERKAFAAVPQHEQETKALAAERRDPPVNLHRLVVPKPVVGTYRRAGLDDFSHIRTSSQHQDLHLVVREFALAYLVEEVIDVLEACSTEVQLRGVEQLSPRGRLGFVGEEHDRQI